MAQWLAQGTHNPSVAGSNPAGPTKCMLTRLLCFVIVLRVQYGDIAQLGERMTGSHEVRGSIPLISTMKFRPSLARGFFIEGRTAIDAGVWSVIVGTPITHPISITSWFVDAIGV